MKPGSNNVQHNDSLTNDLYFVCRKTQAYTLYNDAIEPYIFFKEKLYIKNKSLAEEPSS